MNGVAVGANGRRDDLPVVIPEDSRLLRRHRAAPHRLGVSLARVVHPQRKVPHPVAVAMNVIGDQARVFGQVGTDRRRQDETDLVLLEEVTRPVPDSGLGPPVPHELKAEGGPVIVTRLSRVAHPELDVVGAVDGKRVAGGDGGGEGVGLHAVLRGVRFTQRKDSHDGGDGRPVVTGRTASVRS